MRLLNWGAFRMGCGGACRRGYRPLRPLGRRLHAVKLGGRGWQGVQDHLSGVIEDGKEEGYAQKGGHKRREGGLAGLYQVIDEWREDDADVGNLPYAAYLFGYLVAGNRVPHYGDAVEEDERSHQEF